MQTLMRSGTLLYDPEYSFLEQSHTISNAPKLNLNPHSRNTLFSRKRWLKKGIAGMKIWVLVILYTFIRSQTLLCNFRTLLYDPEHPYTVIILSNIYDGACCKAFTIT